MDAWNAEMPGTQTGTVACGAIPVRVPRVLSYAFLVAFVFTIPLSGCGRPTEEAATPSRRPAMPVQVETVAVRDLTRRAVYTGSVEPTRVARMASPAEGPIVECTIREGDRVSAGQPLVRVGRSRIAESNLAAAREELKRQRSDYERIERLVESGALPGEQREIARSLLKRAEAQVAATETSASDYDIRAPWDGVVFDVFVSEGNYVAPRAPLVDLYDPASLRIRFAVPERDARRIEVGAVAQTMLDAFPGQVFDARIERVYARLDPGTRTLMVEADLMTDQTLIVGLFARIATPLETVSGVIAAPAGALVALPDGSIAVFIARDGRAQRRMVRLGLEADGYTEILEGVTPGEVLVVRGQESLRDGAAIRILGDPQAAANARRKDGGAP